MLCNIFLFVSELVIIINRIPTVQASAFSYYTLLSNLLAMAAGLVFMIHGFSGFRRLTKAKTLLRYYATCMLFFTFIIVITVLTPMCLSVKMDPSFLYTGDGALHHLAHPIVSFVSFVFLEDNRALKNKQPAVMLGISLCYTAVLITLNILRIVDGPYPFFQVYNNPVWGTILWLACLAAGDYLLNYLIYRAGVKASRGKNVSGGQTC